MMMMMMMMMIMMMHYSMTLIYYPGGLKSLETIRPVAWPSVSPYMCNVLFALYVPWPGLV